MEIKSGDKFNQLTIVKEIEPHISPKLKKYRKFQCICDCGNITNALLNSLTTNTTKSCGCFKQETSQQLMSKTFYKHGHTSKNGKTELSSTYQTWASMKQRCLYSKNKSYENYGGRGITICDRWLNSFENFLSDMGERFKGYTIDRIDVNGNYEPSNCRWATSKEQSKNKRIKNKE